MAQFKTINPVRRMRGRLTGQIYDGKVEVMRQKSYGKTPDGEERLGPEEYYIYHKHKGEWSPNVVESRSKFAAAQKRCAEELADPERRAYWQARFDEQLNNPKEGEKRYVKLQCYVVAQFNKQS